MNKADYRGESIIETSEGMHDDEEGFLDYDFEKVFDFVSITIVSILRFNAVKVNAHFFVQHSANP